MNRILQIVRSVLSPAPRRTKPAHYDAAVSVRSGTGVVLRDGEIVSVLPAQAVLGLHAAAVERGRTVAARKKREAKAADR